MFDLKRMSIKTTVIAMLAALMLIFTGCVLHDHGVVSPPISPPPVEPPPIDIDKSPYVGQYKFEYEYGRGEYINDDGYISPEGPRNDFIRFYNDKSNPAFSEKVSWNFYNPKNPIGMQIGFYGIFSDDNMFFPYEKKGDEYEVDRLGQGWFLFSLASYFHRGF
ncbi:MAG: hypothetical protein LBU60_03890 [Clostridiales bacterium]|jgi:hypothetical protein|nr:hypothetical protein [Clostridiales bacterium]